MEELRQALAPFYLQIKFVHLLMIAMWTFSTAVAYRNYVVPAFRAWERAPDDPQLIARRDDCMDRFDRGAILEHIAFPLLIVSGLLLVWLGGWNLTQLSWLSLKLGILLLIFLPMEMLDIYISHLGGNKAKIRANGNMAQHESMTRRHWAFLRLSTPLVVLFIPAMFYLAVTKPL